MEYVQDLLTVVWALRWVITIAVILVLTGLLARVVGERNDARALAHDYAIRNLELKYQLGPHSKALGLDGPRGNG